jgi:phytoene/squalene synthetase
VGRIVLAVHGVRDERRTSLSDSICTALQLANFWQDVSVDRAKGRVYLPVEDLRRHGVSESELDAPSATERLRGLVLEEAAWTRSMFEAGRPLFEDPPPGLGLHLRLVWLGGMRIVEPSGGRRGRPGEASEARKRDAALVILRAVARRRRPPRGAVTERRAES